MYRIKNSIFLELTKNQKSDFLSFVKIYIKNYKECDPESIYYNLLDEIEYFHNFDPPRYPFVDLNNEQHLSDIKKYVYACKKHLDYKESLKPIYEEQKRIQKEIRSKIIDEKQKKEPPTKKQISYYKSLCKKHNKQPIPADELSKYDIKIEIQQLIELSENTNTTYLPD